MSKQRLWSASTLVIFSGPYIMWKKFINYSNQGEPLRISEMVQAYM